MEYRRNGKKRGRKLPFLIKALLLITYLLHFTALQLCFVSSPPVCDDDAPRERVDYGGRRAAQKADAIHLLEKGELPCP